MTTVVHQLVGGLRAAMGYTGAASLAEFRAKAQFIRVSGAGMRESRVHDVEITHEAPNYLRPGIDAAGGRAAAAIEVLHAVLERHRPRARR